MKTLVTGSLGLVGSEAVRFFLNTGKVVGIDNNQRDYFFKSGKKKPIEDKDYFHFTSDIRNEAEIRNIVKNVNPDLIIHAAAQPSHDWAAKEPITDFDINARATLILLEAAKEYCPGVVFIHVSTNKVYGDWPNLNTQNTFWELTPIDRSTHSLFGCSKLSADVYVQEYGLYFGMKTGVFRCGCITGPNHAGAEQHGFLSYLMKCAKNKIPYTIYGHNGEQVRDNIHSYDLVNAFWHYYQLPGHGEVYNIGGGPNNAISMNDAIKMCEEITGNQMEITYVPEPRKGDHYKYITDYSKFKKDFPKWEQKYNLETILKEIYASS